MRSIEWLYCNDLGWS